MSQGSGLALVTGATGFIGANLARLLLETGRDLRLLARSGSDLRNLPRGSGVSVFEGDLRDSQKIEAATRAAVKSIM